MLRDSDEETPEASTTSSHPNPAEVSGPASARSDFFHAQRWTPSALKEGQPFRLLRLSLIDSPRGLALRATNPQRPTPAACLEPSGVGSKLVKDPSVVIVRGKTISGPLAVLPFTSPAAKIIDDANDLCENSLQFRRMFAFWHFFAESQLRKKICRIFSDSTNVAQIQMNVDQSLRGKSTLV